MLNEFKEELSNIIRGSISNPTSEDEKCLAVLQLCREYESNRKVVSDTTTSIENELKDLEERKQILLEILNENFKLKNLEVSDFESFNNLLSNDDEDLTAFILNIALIAMKKWKDKVQ